MPIDERMQLAAGKPLPRKLYAAMAQQDCGQCGYLCETYSKAIADGTAYEAYERWISAQGGHPSEDVLPVAPVVLTVKADREGYVGALGAVAVGQAALHLGAGRRTKDETIDHGVGIVCLRKRGDRIAAGEPLAEIHAASDDAAEEAAREVAAAYTIADEPPPQRSVVLDVLA